MIIKNYILVFSGFFSLTLFPYCSNSSNEDSLFVEVTLGQNGLVSVVANSLNISSYRFSFGPGAIFNNSSGEVQYRYQNTGIFTIAVWAFYDENQESFLQKIIDVEIKNASGGPQVISSDSYIDDSEVVTQHNGYTLVWNDEFNYEGAPSDLRWHLQFIPLFGGGWANDEKQHYTTRRENSLVSNGTLKIIAQKENFTYAGSSKKYTSARLNSKYPFTYGRIDVSAKLPSTAGTWPAIWTLGANINEVGNYFGDQYGNVGWPACGEIDIMEQKGDKKSFVQGYFHWADTKTGEYASYGEEKSLSDLGLDDLSLDFHTYSLIWDKSIIKVMIDDKVVVQLSNASNNPFDNSHYLLLNLAMGGALGGYIPENFEKDQMEIDFVRIYQ